MHLARWIVRICFGVMMESREGRQLVEEILRQMSEPDGIAAAPALLSAMIEVGRRHPLQTVPDEPVVAELVLAALRVSQPSIVQGGHSGEMCDWIAHSLCDDPLAAARLQSLWLQLLAGRGA
jgi:hypothetical protein